MAYPSNIATYVAWMEAMASQHVLIAHGQGSGNKDSYQEIWLSGTHFEGIDYRTFFSSIRNKVKYPVLINMGVDFNHPATQGDGVSVAQATFAILCRVEKDTPLMVSRLACYNTAEGIAKDILARIEKYMEANMAYGYLAAPSETEPIGPIALDGDLYGVVASFKYAIKVPLCYDEDKWTHSIEIETI